MATQYAIQSASGTLTASTAQPIQFTSDGTSTGAPVRFAYVAVCNTATSGNISVRTDGTAATVSGEKTITVMPGQTVVVANAAAYWTQAASVIAQSTGTASNLNTNQGTDAEVQPYGSSYYGQLASPGTTVSLISAGTPSFTVSATG